MKFIEKVKTTLISTKKSTERFPVTIIVSTILTILLIYLNEVNLELVEESRTNLERLIMVVGLGVPLSLCIGLLHERFSKVNKYIKYVLGALLLILYYNFLLKNFNMVTGSRYLGTMIFLLIVIFYALKLKNDLNYEKYVIKIFFGGFITVIYSGVLYLGLTAIFLTINTLFDANIDSKIYLYMFFIVVFIFGVSLFISKLPEKNEDLSNQDYSKSLKILLIYIVIPLITVYTLILYAYFLKIIVTWVWPKGLVSHLVLWYSAISVGVIFLITPVLNENKIANIFKIWFPKLIFPIQLMMFISIFQRISQYGITENRYYIVVLGLWVLGIMIYFSIKKSLKNILIPITLSIVVLLSVYGPLSSYSISMLSQNNRLNTILEENNMLIDGVIKGNANAANDVQREISNIINYFHSNHSLRDIKVLPNDFELGDTKEIFGFIYNPYNQNQEYQNYFSYFLDKFNDPIDIAGYDYYVQLSSWNKKFIDLDNLEIKYSNDHILTVEAVGNDILSINLNDVVGEIHDGLSTEAGQKNVLSQDKMTVNLGNDNIKIRIIFSNINGRVDVNTNKITLENTEFILLVDFN